jgi:glyoxylase-like metal-dependent hydrolase (beta-lactamase superfamily II)
MSDPHVAAFHDPDTGALTYLVTELDSGLSAVIDPILDLDLASGRIETRSADRVAETIERDGLRVLYTLDTHVHADHLTGLDYFRLHFGARTGIGGRIVDMQKTLRDRFHDEETLAADGSQYDMVFEPDERLALGGLEIRVLHTPGHTPGCVSYLIGDALFVGDLLFQPDAGTARCDFPGGSAETLYESIQTIYRTLPGSTRVFTGHDYRPGGRPLRYVSTLAEQMASNVQVRLETERGAFARMRRERDATLGQPRLILPSLQWNVRAGHFPGGQSTVFLKLPLQRPSTLVDGPCHEGRFESASTDARRANTP